jgi:ATP-binding cassette subfamily B (MDR/TAP) protein 1
MSNPVETVVVSDRSFEKLRKETIEDMDSSGSDDGEDELLKKYTNEKNYSMREIFRRLFEHSQSSCCYFFFCFIFSIISGAIYPLFALTFSQMLTIMNNPEDPDFTSKADFIALCFLALAITYFISLGSQLAIGAYVGENLTKNLRIALYQKILNLDMTWFDLSWNTPGQITSKLSSDPSAVNGLISTLLSLSLTSVSSLIIGIIVAFLSSWQVSLVTFFLSPFVLVASYFFQEFVMGFSSKNDVHYKASSGFLTDMVTNIRTVTALNQQHYVIDKYQSMLETPLKLAKNKSVKAGLAFAFS